MGTRPDTGGQDHHGKRSWTFLSNHAHVLICIADDPEARMRELALRIGITERAVQRIVHELEEADFLRRHREGRRNRYRIDRNIQLRHPVEAHCTVGQLLTMVQSNGT